MPMDAYALVRISPETLTRSFAPGADGRRVGANGAALKLTLLEDAALLDLGLGFAAEPDALAVAARALLGELLDQHDDPRGVFVLPDVARPRARRYDAVLEEVGEVGQFVPRVGREHVARAKPAADPTASSPSAPRPSAPRPSAARPVAPPPELEAQLAGLMSALPPDAMAQIEAAMKSGDPAAMGRVQEQLLGALGGAGGLAQLQQSVAQMLGMEGGSMEDIAAALGLPTDDSPESMARLESEIEAMRRDNPELLARLEAELGGAGLAGRGGPKR